MNGLGFIKLKRKKKSNECRKELKFLNGKKQEKKTQSTHLPKWHNGSISTPILISKSK